MWGGKRARKKKSSAFSFAPRDSQEFAKWLEKTGRSDGTHKQEASSTTTTKVVSWIKKGKITWGGVKMPCRYGPDQEKAVIKNSEKGNLVLRIWNGGRKKADGGNILFMEWDPSGGRKK